MKVSVIIPNYNLARYLPDAIDSVLAQDYDSLEIIVVDDGSNENTKDYINQYLSKIKYIYQTNGGEAKSRNTGIKAATGDALIFLDADDVLPEKAVSTLAIQMAKLSDEYCLVHGEMEKFDDKSAKTLGITCFRNISQNRRKLFTHRTNLILASLVRKQALESVGMFKEEIKFGACSDVLMRLAKIGKFYSIEQICYKYRIRDNSQSKIMTRDKALAVDKWRLESLKQLLQGESVYTKAAAWSAYYTHLGKRKDCYTKRQSCVFLITAMLFNPFNLVPLKALVKFLKTNIMNNIFIDKNNENF